MPGDQVINIGKQVTSSNEKYYRLLAGQPLDDCLKRTSIRNLRMFADGLHLEHVEEQRFVADLPELPEGLLQQFQDRDRQGQFE